MAQDLIAIRNSFANILGNNPNPHFQVPTMQAPVPLTLGTNQPTPLVSPRKNGGM